MSTEKLAPMDIYSSRMDIPFDVATFCRGHKFSVDAVNLARAIRDAAAAKEEVLAAEKRLASSESIIESCIINVKQKMGEARGV